MENKNEPMLIRVEEAAKLLGISRSHIYQWIAREELPVVRIGRSVRISVRTLEAWVAERESKPSHL